MSHNLYIYLTTSPHERLTPPVIIRLFISVRVGNSNVISLLIGAWTSIWLC